MFDVFISYSSKNIEYAKIICQHLESKGIKCWYAPRDIAPGEPWASAIVSAIRKTKIFVLVFSEHSNGSKQVLREVNLAADKNRYIIPFKIDNTDMEGDMEYYLQSLHWVDAYGRPVEDAVSDMAKKIKTIIGVEEPETEESSKAETTTEAQDEVEAEAVVEEEMESCNILGVNTDFEAAKDAEETENAESEDAVDEYDEEDEDDEDDEGPDIVQRVFKYAAILSGILALAFLIWDYAYPPIQKWLDRDKINFVKISEYGNYRYPFYGMSMFVESDDMMFMEDTESKKLVLTKTDTGYPVIKDIEYNFDKPFFHACYANKESDIVYFYNTSKRNVKIYDRVKNKWINSKGVDLKLSFAEQLSEVLYVRSSLNVSKEKTDDIMFFAYDYAEGKGCFSKIINLRSDGTFDVIDISKHKLVSLIGLSKPQTALMWTEDERIKVLDYSDGTVLELSHKEIVKNYVPYLNSGNDVLSPDKRYVCRQQRTNGALNVGVWELESGQKVFSSTFAKKSSAYFSADSKLLCYNRENNKLMEYTFGKKEKQRVVFDRDYFAKKGEFIEYPHSFYYSATLDKCFFSSVKEYKDGKYKDKLVMTDLEGNIVGRSEEFEVPGISALPDVFVDADRIFYIYNIADGPKTFDDGTYSIIYRAMYTMDDDGNIKFD